MNETFATQINQSVESLFASMQERISAEDMQRVRDAYALAAEAHSQQLRKTGEPYIIHPIAVARIVAEELELGANPVIAAFLHDVAYHSKDMDYMDGVTSSFYNDDIRVFTPKGKEILLPKDATALDFAYEIHSEIGKHAVYARINGKLMFVKTVLNRGDCVEIGMDEASMPDPDWVDHVLTYKAKRHLRSYLSSLSSIEYTRCPHCHPLPGDEVVGFMTSDGKTVLHKRNCQSAILMASQQGDSILAVEFKEEDRYLYPVRI